MASGEDSAWKEILELRFRGFLELLFPQIAVDIDWSRGYEPLDKELEPILRHAQKGRRILDKLVKVFLRDGAETWVLVQVEVQGAPEAGLDERMLDCNHRTSLRCGHEVVSPAVVVLAHLDTLRSCTPRESLEVEFGLLRRLYERGLTREDVIALHRFIDWLVCLPDDLEEELHEPVKQEIEGPQAIPYVSSIERFAMAKGWQEGMAEAMAEGKTEGLGEGLVKAAAIGLELRFGAPGIEILSQVRQIADVARLQRIVDAIDKGASLEAVRSLLEGR